MKRVHEREKEKYTNPPPYNPTALPAEGGTTFHPQTWQTANVSGDLVTFPVFVDNARNRYHEPLDFKIVKNLAESVQAYGINAAFTVAMIESFERYAMTPGDWQRVTKVCLNPGQYLDWKSTVIEKANEQASKNRVAGNPTWDIDMLLGQGRFLNNQIGYPQQVYEQINTICIQGWKALPSRREVSGNLTKITQGPTEPFSDFVVRMMEAAGRIFGDAESAMPLVKQLVYEQCTKECRAAIMPFKGKPLEVWLKVCREIRGPLTSSSIAAAVIAITNQTRKKPRTSGECFSCGRPGHM